MKGLYTLARGLAALFGFIVLLGALWFSGAPAGSELLLPGIILGISSIGASLVPAHRLANATVRRVLLALCIVGIGAGLVMIGSDIKTSTVIEWDVIAMKSLHIAALAMMAFLAIQKTAVLQERRTSN